jgi:hypothetical protein
MENTKIMALPQQVENDDDCFIRLCDSRQQQLRRMALRKKGHQKQMAVSAVKHLLAALGGAAVMTGIMSLIWGCMA